MEWSSEMLERGRFAAGVWVSCSGVLLSPGVRTEVTGPWSGVGNDAVAAADPNAEFVRTSCALVVERAAAL